MIIYVEAKPGARKNEYDILNENTLRVRIAAPAVDGKANDALIDYLAKILKVSKSSVRLLKGTTSMHKKIDIEITLSDWSDFINKT
ncbi:MAG: DUF167 domain-containing protein [Flavobacteriales bacterium]|nr:DUF167 domain-containing protein [Flavobacteriales bacterium]